MDLEQEEAEEEEEKEDEAVTFLIGCLVLPDEYFQCSTWFDSGYLHIRPSMVVFRARISDSHCSVLVLPDVYRIMVFWEMTSGICFGILFLCLVRQRILFFASVYGVVEFHVFLREKWITVPEVDPRLSGHVLRPLVSDSHLYGVRVCLWSTRLWIFLGDDSRKGFRIQHSLV